MTLDALSLCEMTRNDRPRCALLFLLGANDGVLPAAEEPRRRAARRGREALEGQQIFLAPHRMEQVSSQIQIFLRRAGLSRQKNGVRCPFPDGKEAEKGGHRSSSGASRVLLQIDRRQTKR